MISLLGPTVVVIGGLAMGLSRVSVAILAVLALVAPFGAAMWQDLQTKQRRIEELEKEDSSRPPLSR